MKATTKKYGRKYMIKIENVVDLDLTALAILDENLTVNIIEDEKITNKIKINLPEKVEGLLKCNNPRCISTNERNITTKFSLVDRNKRLNKCVYDTNFYN